MEIAVSEYKKRRADRLAVRGVRPEYNSNWDSPLDITSFQKRRNERLKKRGIDSAKKVYDPFRMDAPEDDSDNNNNQKSGGSHGNTRLPFGLCKRFGIEIGADWGPREAWDALAGKGITPDGAYERLKKGEDPGTPDMGEEEKKPSVNITHEGTRYKVVGAHSADEVEKMVGYKKWVLTGRLPGESEMEEDVIESFSSKSELLQYLKDQGVEEFMDPETGEMVNPKEMEIPKDPVKKFAVEHYGGAEYDNPVCRYRSWVGRGGDPWIIQADLIVGTAPFGKYTPSRFAKTFWTKADMMYWLKEKGVEEIADPETGEMVNPQDMELPKKDITIDGRGYSDLSIGLRGGKYTIVGKDLDGKKRSIRETSSLADAQGYLKMLGVDPDDVKLSPSLKKREKERVGWLTSTKKEYVTADDGKRYGDLLLTKSGDWSTIWTITGEDEEGGKKYWQFRTKTEAMKFMKDQGCEKVRFGKESENPQDYDIPDVVAKVGKTPCQEVGVHVGRYGDPTFYGVDLDGGRFTFGSKKYKEKFSDFFDRVKSEYGLTDDMLKISDEDKEKIEELKKEDEERERRKREFEEKAVAFGRYKFLDPHLGVDSDGDYRIYGYDEDGEKKAISTWGDMYDMDDFCEHHGLKLEDYVKSPEMKEAYEKYKQGRKEFDEKAVDVGGTRYKDIEISYDVGWYYIKGEDARGRRKTIASPTSYDDLNKWLEKSGFTPDSFPMTDAAKERADKAKKAKDLIARGDWYSMGVSDEAFTNVKIKRGRTGDWQIIAEDVDGNERGIGSTKETWDDAVSEAAKYGVKKYKVFDGDKELGMPKNGIHSVVLMKKPGGGFVVSAATTEKPRATVYETNSEEDARKWLEDNNVPSSSIRTRGMNPNDDVVRTHTAKSLSEFDTHRMKAIEGSFIDKMTDEEKKDAADMLTEIFSKGEYRAARGLSNFGNIVENGYKSQLETGTGGTGAAITRSGRKATSEKMYGHGDLEDNEYEKMGYLAPADDGEDYDDGAHPFYGPMTLTFKKDNMKDRATYTWGDSLNTRSRLKSAGYAGEHPTIEGFTSLYGIREMREALDAWKQYKAGEISYKDMFDQVRENANNNYIEMQFNGPVTIDDISKVSWQSSGDVKRCFDKMKGDQRKRVMQILKDKNVGLIYRTNDGFKDAWELLDSYYPDDKPN